MTPNPRTPNEVDGFQVRTTIDDMIGRLMFIRERLLIEVPDGLEAVLHDSEAHIERAVGLAEDLPDNEDWDAPSGSPCHWRGCSCGMPSWGFDPPGGQP